MATASNEFKLIGPSDVEQYHRSAVTLSCHLSPEISAVNMEIRWFKETDCVCVYKNRQVTEGKGYEGRVSLFTQELERGNVSLQLRDCTESDTGHYLCQVTDGDRTEEITVVMIEDRPVPSVYSSDMEGNLIYLDLSLKKLKESSNVKPKVKSSDMVDDLMKSLEAVRVGHSVKVDDLMKSLEAVRVKVDDLMKSLEAVRVGHSVKKLKDESSNMRDQSFISPLTSIFQPPLTSIFQLHPPDMLVSQSDRTWTGDERLSMELSALQTVNEESEESAVLVRRRNSMDGIRPSLSEETEDSAAALRRRNSMHGIRPSLSGETRESAAPVRRRTMMEGNLPTISGETLDSSQAAPVRQRNSMEGNRPSMSGETQNTAAPIRRRTRMEGERSTRGGEPSGQSCLLL